MEEKATSVIEQLFYDNYKKMEEEIKDLKKEIKSLEREKEENDTELQRLSFEAFACILFDPSIPECRFPPVMKNGEPVGSWSWYTQVSLEAINPRYRYLLGNRSFSKIKNYFYGGLHSLYDKLLKEAEAKETEPKEESK